MAFASAKLRCICRAAKRVASRRERKPEECRAAPLYMSRSQTPSHPDGLLRKRPLFPLERGGFKA